MRYGNNPRVSQQMNGQRRHGTCMPVLSCFSHGQLFVTLWTISCQAPLSMGFSRQKYWSGLHALLGWDLSNRGIKPMCLTSLALAGRFLTTNSTYIYSVEYYSGVRKKEILPFATTWVDLQGIMLSEMSEKDKYYMASLT